MPTEGQQLFKSRDSIVQDLISSLQVRVSDAYIGEDGNLVLLFQVFGDTTEAVYSAVQLTSDEMFISTASPSALERHGDEFGVPLLAGTYATGTLLFIGDGGTSIPTGTEVAYDPGSGGDPLYFLTTSDVSIPNPGVPTAPTIADGGGSGAMAAGTYEYAITFYTADGETTIGLISGSLTQAASHKVSISAIPLGGTGTVGRKIYRSKNGGAYALVHQISDVVTTTYLDNIADGSLGAAPPTTSTGNQVSAPAQSEAAGTKYNLLSNTITILTNAPDGLTSVNNVAGFSNGTDNEDTESYRQRLIEAVRNPGTGSPGDLRTWAEKIEGVGTATVFENETIDVNLLNSNEASAETDASGWTNVSNTTVASSSTQAADGTKSVRMTAIANGNMSIRSASKTIASATLHTGMVFMRAGSTARQVMLTLEWRDSGDTFISSTDSTSGKYDSSSGFIQFFYAATPPANAAKVRLIITVLNAASSEIHYADKMLICRGLITAWTPGDTILSPAPGHTTIRISAPDGSVPSADVIAEVLGAVSGQDLANVSLHVAGFTPLSQDVDVTATPSNGYVLADISTPVTDAITAYTNSIPAGGTWRIAGATAAAISVIGVDDIVITSPGTNMTATAAEKFVIGVVTVS